MYSKAVAPAVIVPSCWSEKPPSPRWDASLGGYLTVSSRLAVMPPVLTEIRARPGRTAVSSPVTGSTRAILGSELVHRWDIGSATGIVGGLVLFLVAVAVSWSF